MKKLTLVLAGLVLTPVAYAETPADPVKAAVEKGLRRIEQGAASYPTHRQCFSCHHQAMSILSLTAARQRGFKVEEVTIRQQLDLTLKTYQPKTEQVRKGQGVGGASTTVGYALLALEVAGHKPDETTEALVEFLLKRQRADGAWPMVSKRPPTEDSLFTNSGLALRALRAYGPAKDAEGADELRERVERAFAKGRDWLLENEPRLTEDRVFHLRGLIAAEADKAKIEAARTALVKEQRTDGGWSQLPDMESDAYATATVLTTLRLAGLPATDAAYLKGVKYLLANQKDDGAWIVETRSKPIQVFFDNGDPGGKSQFISFVATNWAVLALLETLPVK